MDPLAFIAKMTESVAWPIFILIMFLLLRKEIVQAIPRLQRLKLKYAELEFQQQAQVLESSLPETSSTHILNIQQELKDIAPISPRLSIIEAWSQIEFALGKYASSKKIVTVKENIYAHLLYHAVAKEVFGEDKKLFEWYNSLRQLRNKAVHDQGFEPSPDNAYAFAVLASRLIEAIETRTSI